jgi:predicted  nucleic acid-binding Zn-ribbon protein
VSLYIDQIRHLAALQRVDDGIHAVQLEIEAAPAEVQELEKNFASLDSQRSWIQDKIKHLQDQQRRLNYDIKDEEARLANSRNKLMQVQNDHEYQAVMREIDIMKRQNMTREEELMALRDELAKQEANLKEQETAWTEAKSNLETQKNSLSERLAACQEKLTGLEAERTTVGNAIEPPILKRYEFIRDRLRHPVIVPVTEGICSGCNMMLPPQTFIELQRGASILSCPSCQRLIFWSTDIPEETETKDSAPAEETAE